MIYKKYIYIYIYIYVTQVIQDSNRGSLPFASHAGHAHTMITVSVSGSS